MGGWISTVFCKYSQAEKIMTNKPVDMSKFKQLDGTFQSDMSGTFVSDTGGTFISISST